MEPNKEATEEFFPFLLPLKPRLSAACILFLPLDFEFPREQGHLSRLSGSDFPHLFCDEMVCLSKLKLSSQKAGSLFSIPSVSFHSSAQCSPAPWVDDNLHSPLGPYPCLFILDVILTANIFYVMGMHGGGRQMCWH